MFNALFGNWKTSLAGFISGAGVVIGDLMNSGSLSLKNLAIGLGLLAWGIISGDASKSR